VPAALETFRTPRLTAERIGASDFEAVLRMHQDERVMATLGGVKDEAETRSFLSECEAHWARYGYGFWMFRDGLGRFIGRGGVRSVELEGARETEIAYAVNFEFWRQGYATEMAGAMLRIAFDYLAASSVVAFVLPHNLASRRVLERIGLACEREVTWKSYLHVLYRARAGPTPS
jgi:RimJ/RimL family protein N-acetyltransferase